MPKTIASFLERLGHSMVRGDGAGLGDGELLERYLASRDEVAFEALVRRHGPMVLGVCRRILRNESDAEDAFQATFLVLVRKAASVRPRSMVANWLFGVAHNTARKAKVMNIRRRIKERELVDHFQPQTEAEDWQRLHELLDDEISRLPDRYRVVIVQCDLEGKTIKEAARRIGCPPATLSSRLTRGRALLARRMARHGPAFSLSLIAAALSQNAASAYIPACLMASTTQAARVVAAGAIASGVISAKVTLLTEGVLRAMLLTKLKIATLLLLIVGVGASIGTVIHGAKTTDRNPVQQEASCLLMPAARFLKPALEPPQGWTVNVNPLEELPAVPVPRAEAQKGWVVELRGLTYHRDTRWTPVTQQLIIDFQWPQPMAAPKIDPVEGHYYDDLRRVLENCKIQKA